MNGTIVIEYTRCADGREVRETIEPQPMGNAIRRVEERHRGKWRTESTEAVKDVERRPGMGHTNRGP